MFPISNTHGTSSVHPYPNGGQRSHLFGNLLPLDADDRGGHAEGQTDLPTQMRSRPRARHQSTFKCIGTGFDAADSSIDASDADPLMGRRYYWRQPGGNRLIGDAAALALALLLTFVTTALADAFRTSDVAMPSIADKTALGFAASVTTLLAGRSIAYMWSRLAPRDARLRHTLLDVASAYLLTVAAFGTIFGFVGALSGAERVVLMPDVVPGTTLRALDGMYVMTFVAAGVGFPHVFTEARQAAPSVWLHLVGWACSLMTTTFVGKVLIATALSVRLVHEDERNALDIEGGKLGFGR